MGGTNKKKLKCALAIVLAFNLSACHTPSKHLGGYMHSVTTFIKSPLKKRGLATREAQLLNRLFGYKINTDKVEVWLYESPHETLIADSSKNIIRIFGTENYSDNYSVEDNPDLYGAFIYNATLVAQYQSDIQWRFNKRITSTSYTLDPDKNISFFEFHKFGRYQQAAIMEDYARRFTHKSHQMNHIREQTNPDNCDAQHILSYTVEQNFPHATALRHLLSPVASRDLTDNEKLFLRTFFQGEIVNWETVSLTQQPMYCYDRTASTPSAANITFWGTTNHSDDYTTEKLNPVLYRLFFHEAVHIWQAQNNYKFTNWKHVNPAGKYLYELDLDKWSFDDYEVEQQGRIIEDYVGIYLHPAQEAGTARLSNQEKQQLQTLVEDRFPGAKTMRLKMHTPRQQTTLHPSKRKTLS